MPNLEYLLQTAGIFLISRFESSLLCLILHQRFNMAHFHSLTVQKIKPLTPNSVAITFAIPKELIQTFAFTAGQYITIKKEIKGKELRRAYSISSSPKCEGITIGVKKVDKGAFQILHITNLK